MIIEDAPLHQLRRRVLVDAPLGETTCHSIGKPAVVTKITFGVRGDRRYWIILGPKEARELRDYLTTCLAGQPA